MRWIVIFTGKSIYKRETVSNKNIGLVIEYGYTSTIGTALLVWLVDLFFSDWSPLLPYMANRTAHCAERVGDTQYFHANNTECFLLLPIARRQYTKCVKININRELMIVQRHRTVNVNKDKSWRCGSKCMSVPLITHCSETYHLKW